jgi:hypothetical protein
VLAKNSETAPRLLVLARAAALAKNRCRLLYLPQAAALPYSDGSYRKQRRYPTATAAPPYLAGSDANRSNLGGILIVHRRLLLFQPESRKISRHRLHSVRRRRRARRASSSDGGGRLHRQNTEVP